MDDNFRPVSKTVSLFDPNKTVTKRLERGMEHTGAISAIIEVIEDQKQLESYHRRNGELMQM
jgi:hypothetical protein